MYNSYRLTGIFSSGSDLALWMGVGMRKRADCMSSLSLQITAIMDLDCLSVSKNKSKCVENTGVRIIQSRTIKILGLLQIFVKNADF